jgi:DNA-binding GntR family transcriptional regulator
METSKPQISRRGTALHQEDVSYRQLRDAIATGELLPSQRLVESDLAASLGVGRAAIRTAIARLAQENLVERQPNRGARVRRVSDEEALEVVELRLVLECLVVRHAAQHADARDTERLARIMHDMEQQCAVEDMAGFARTNAQFHGEVLRIARHETARRMLDSLLSHRFELQRLTTPARPSDRLSEHRVIYDAMCAHDPDAAERAMYRHLCGVVERWRNRVKAEQARRSVAPRLNT